MNKSARTLTSPRFARLLLRAAGLFAVAGSVALTAGCVTGESTFQTLPGGVFGGLPEPDTFTWTVGTQRKAVFDDKGTDVQPSLLGDFEYRANPRDPWLALAVEGPVKNMVDGRRQQRRFEVFTALERRERICVSPASDFVAPYLTSRRETVRDNPVAAGEQATRALIAALGGIVGPATQETDFARACLSDGMTDQVRVMVLTSLMLESARDIMGAAWMNDAALYFDEHGTLRPADVAVFQDAFKDADLDRLEAELDAAFKEAGVHAAAAYLRLMADQDFDGVADADDDCVAVRGAACACGNDIVDHGEACDGPGDGPGQLCSSDCLELAVCGDGELQEGEVLDTGAACSESQCTARTCDLEAEPAQLGCENPHVTHVVGLVPTAAWSVPVGMGNVLVGLVGSTLYHYGADTPTVLLEDVAAATPIRLPNGETVVAAVSHSSAALIFVTLDGSTETLSIFAGAAPTGQAEAVVRADVDGDDQDEILVVWRSTTDTRMIALTVDSSGPLLTVAARSNVLTIEGAESLIDVQAKGGVVAVLSARAVTLVTNDTLGRIAASSTPLDETLQNGSLATTYDGWLIRGDATVMHIDQAGTLTREPYCLPLDKSALWAASSYENRHLWMRSDRTGTLVGTWSAAATGSFMPNDVVHRVSSTNVVLLRDGSGFVAVGPPDATNSNVRMLRWFAF